MYFYGWDRDLRRAYRELTDGKKHEYAIEDSMQKLESEAKNAPDVEYLATSENGDTQQIAGMTNAPVYELAKSSSTGGASGEKKKRIGQGRLQTITSSRSSSDLTGHTW